MFEYIGYIKDTCTEYDKDEDEIEFSFCLEINNIYVDGYGDWGFTRNELYKALDKYPNNKLTSNQKKYIIQFLEENYLTVDEDCFWYTDAYPCAFTNFKDDNNKNILENDIVELYFDEEKQSSRRLLVRFNTEQGAWSLYTINGDVFSTLYFARSISGTKMIVCGNTQKGDELDKRNVNIKSSKKGIVDE